MATFESTYTDTLTVRAPLGDAVAHFANLQTILAQTEDLETGTVDGDVVHFVLKAQEHTGIGTFKGDYRCRYVAEKEAVRWDTVGEGNTRQSGSATFEVVDAITTEVTYTERIAIDMDVPKLMAPVLGQIISPMLKHALAGFAKRMVKALEA